MRNEWHTPPMNFLKRIELWVLLAVVVGGLAWVFTSRHSPDEEMTDAGPGTVTAEKSTGPLKLHRSVIERDYGNARLDIELQIRNDNDEKLKCLPPKVRLLTVKGREIPSFFLPFDKQPEVPGKTTQDVQLRYWTEEADLAGGLILEVEGNKLDIKSAKPFDLKALKTGEKRTFKPGEW